MSADPTPSIGSTASTPTGAVAWSARLAATGRLAAYRQIVVWWALSRVLVLGSALTVQVIGWPRSDWYPSALDQPFALLGAWDGRWYRMIAENGYFVIPQEQSDTAFYPLFPLLLHVFGSLGLSLDAAGLVLANGGFLVGLVALYELARTWLPERDAMRTVIYAAVTPFGFIFSMVYPEGIVIAAMALAGLFAVRGRWLACAAAAAVATAGRPEGFFLVLPIAAVALHVWPRLSPSERGRAVAAVLAAPAALAGFALYQWLAVGDPLAFSEAQREWGRYVSIDGVWRAGEELLQASANDREWLYRDAAFLVLYVVCLAVAWRARVPRSWVAAGAAIVLLPLVSGSVTSIARFGLLALPIYAGLAVLGRRAWLHRALVGVSSALLCLGTATLLLHWP